jgi:hypothetical protein
MLPYSLQLLSDALPGVQVPSEPFDPKGEWEHTFVMWNPARAAKNAKSEQAGSLRIRKRLAPNGKIRLQVTQVIKMQGVNGSGVTRASITCADDDLATPIRWTVDSEILDPKGKQVPLTSTSVSGENAVQAGRLTTSNWSLFEAVQRLPFDCRELRFEMFEEMELRKPEHRLWPGAAADVEIGGRTVKLHSFEQIGRGILPMTYWLDDQHRLIIAVNARRAYLLDSRAGGAK